MKRQPTVDILADVLTATPAPFSQENSGALVWIPVGRIYDNPFQTRQAYDDAHIRRLADNMWSLRTELPATQGMQQPPVARVVEFLDNGDSRPLRRDAYADGQELRSRLDASKVCVELHFGHNRLRAWKLLRNQDANAYAEFPVFLAYADDQAMWRHAVSENAQRKDISPVEEALSMRQAIDRFKLSQKEAGAPFGYANTTVSNKLRLLELPERLLTMLAAGQISERHGRALLQLAPAPALWDHFTDQQLQEWTVADLEDEIEEIICMSRPLPPAPGTGYKTKTGQWSGARVEVEKSSPPPWPYDWMPANAGPNAPVKGACVGCQHRVQFAADPGPRCVKGNDTCFQNKTIAWNQEQAKAQQAVIEAARQASAQAATAAQRAAVETAAAQAERAAAQADVLGFDGQRLVDVIAAYLHETVGDDPAACHKALERFYPITLFKTLEDRCSTRVDDISTARQQLLAQYARAAGISAPAEGKLLVDWTPADWANAKADAATQQASKAADDATALAAAAAALPTAPAMPDAPVVHDLPPSDLTWFSTRYSYGNAPADLLTRDLCNKTRCECFVLAYNSHPQDHHVRPDPEHAPNMCYACTSTGRLAHRRKELEYGDVKAHQKRVKEEQAEAERLLKAAYATYAATDLWHNRVFLEPLVRYGCSIQQSYTADKWPLEKLQESLFLGVAAKMCRKYVETKELWVLEKVSAWIRELETAMGRHVEPAENIMMVTE